MPSTSVPIVVGGNSSYSYCSTLVSVEIEKCKAIASAEKRIECLNYLEKDIHKSNVVAVSLLAALIVIPIAAMIIYYKWDDY